MDVFIGDAVRTPRGKAKEGGGLAGETPHGLVTALIVAMEQRGTLQRQAVERLSLGCVGQIGAQGGHIAMVTKLAAGLPPESVVHAINNFCASGLTAVASTASAVAAGQTKLALAGGIEMMSRVPFMGDRANYYTARDFAPRDQYIPVALAADLLATKQDIGRAEMDRMAVRSQELAAAAENNPELLASRIAVGGLDRDEAVRPLTIEDAAALPPAFADMAQQYRGALDGAEIDHRLTIAHAPPMTDGAGLAVIGTAETIKSPRARIVSYAEMGGDARDSLLAGFAAMDTALARAGLALCDMDRIEFMEAFAVTIAKFVRDRKPDMKRVNVGGGHIAKGHPMGATGAILLSALLDALEAANGRYGLVVAAGAQGIGAAIIVERIAA